MKHFTLGLNGLKAVHDRVIILLPGKQDLAPKYKTYPPSRVNKLTAIYTIRSYSQMIARVLTYLRTLRFLINTLICTARPPLINFCSHHAFLGNGQQFWSSSLLLLIASEVADFPVTCFCFAIIVMVGKEELSNL